MRRFAIILSLALLAFFIWSFAIEPDMIVVEEHDICVKKWADEFNDLRIVLAGDIHLNNLTYGAEKLDEIVEKINSLKPDLVLFTGDYITKRKNSPDFDIATAAKGLSKIRSTYGVYGAFGNHDNLVGWRKMERLFGEIGGVKMLRNSSQTIAIRGKKLMISAIADANTMDVNISAALKGADNADGVIFLSHTPDIIRDIPSKFSIMLSGHTHGGQIWTPKFMRGFIKRRYIDKYERGLVKEDGKTLFITSGLGTSIVPMRFLVPPEIVLLKIRKCN